MEKWFAGLASAIRTFATEVSEASSDNTHIEIARDDLSRAAYSIEHGDIARCYPAFYRVPRSVRRNV
jgi:hypothetical protein